MVLNWRGSDFIIVVFQFSEKGFIVTHQHRHTLALSTYLFIAVIGLRRSVSGWPSGTSYSSWRPGIWSNSTTCTVTAFPWNYGSSSPPGLKVKTGKKWFLIYFMKDYIFSLVGNYNAFPLLCLGVCHFQKFQCHVEQKIHCIFGNNMIWHTPICNTDSHCIFPLTFFFPVPFGRLSLWHHNGSHYTAPVILLSDKAFIDGNEWSVSSFW